MGYQPGDYSGVITTAAVVESQNGNSGFQLTLSCEEHGQIRHTIWVTERSADMAKRQLQACGLTAAEMGSAQLWDDPAPLLVGREVSWRCNEQPDRDGRMWTRVQYIISAGKPASADAKTRSRNLLAGEVGAPVVEALPVAVTDDLVPF